MEDCLQKIRDIANELALASNPVDDEDLVLIALRGLPDEYDAFTITIRNRPSPILMEELTSLLSIGNGSTLPIQNTSKEGCFPLLRFLLNLTMFSMFHKSPLIFYLSIN